MRTWPVQEAKARFSEFLEACIADGPQMVTKRGAEAAVLVLTIVTRNVAGFVQFDVRLLNPFETSGG